MADWDPFADPADEPPEVQPAADSAEPRGRQAGEAWAPPPRPHGRPIRVACLHGTCSNSNVTRMQLQRASKLCGEAVEFIFLDGRMEAEKSNVMWEEMSRTFKGQVFYDWARFKTGPGTSVASRQYHDLDASLLYLQELLRAHEPLDGIFGFSQGANMASLLAAQAVVGQGVNFGFVVHCCPAGPGWIEQRPELFAQKLPMRSLHISGKEDSNPMLPLLSLYEDPASLAHSDGHKVIPSTGGREEADRVAQTIAAPRTQINASRPLADFSRHTWTTPPPAMTSSLAAALVEAEDKLEQTTGLESLPKG
eukprot:s2615_g3.t1